MTGTILTTYDTTGSPESFPELKGTEIEIKLVSSTIGMLTIPNERVIKGNYILQRDLVAVVKF